MILDNLHLLKHCLYCVHDEKMQKEVEKKVLELLEGVLNNKNDHQKEKAIKVFSESLRYFEDSLLYERGIHPNQYELFDPNFMNKFGIKFDEVRKIMAPEINRQYKQFVELF